MVFYKCEKCNKEFNQKSNYQKHINYKNDCTENINNIDNTIYKCDKCNKEFKKKYNYLLHINKLNPCNSKDLIKENKILLEKIQELNNIKKENKEIKKENKNLKIENKEIKIENKKINELYNNLLNK